ncbi:cytochrome c3 family protein [Methylocystis sp. S23]
MRVSGWIAFLVAVTLCCAGLAHADNLVESLVIPGPLIKGHEKLEKECEKCHEPFSRASQSRLCLDCHKEIAKDRANHVRFHGRDRLASVQDCNHCHVDHKGRDADILSLDREAFDHGLTSYPLLGAHRTAACDGCHAPKTPFHKTPSRCVDCHKKADPHRGELQDCDGCHEPSSWRALKSYDHGKTKFPLREAHKDVACAACHIGQAYKGISTACGSCHRIQDVHNGRYGEKCENCHNERKWKEARFDHDRTRFPLRGGHAQTKCDACHTGALNAPLGTSCVSCHKEQDPHRGDLGERCERCHGESDWRKIHFDHAQSSFPLLGKHVATPCADCHVTPAYKETPSACQQCHKDVHHKGRLGAEPRCGACHNAESWRAATFDHARQAHYPLTGGHAKLACAACHKEPNPTTLKLPTACESCHKDDHHKGRLGASPKCETCHDTSGWSHWRFDHARQTRFPLVGRHEGVACEACHKAVNPPNLKLSMECYACHGKQDAHNGAFGRFCERCHTPTGWRNVRIPN